MSNLFHIIQDAQVIIQAKGGVFYQRKVYRRGNRIYAGHGGGFIRLGGGDATSCPNCSWSDLDLPDPKIIVGRGVTGEPLVNPNGEY